MTHGRRVRAVVALAGVTVVLASCGTSGPTSLSVSGAWARTTPAGATNGAVYLTVTSPRADHLVGVSVDPAVAAAAEMHATMEAGEGSSMANMPGMDHSDGDGMSSMHPLTSIALPKGRAVSFTPGKRHIMLTGLTGPLVAGATFELVLHFERAAERTVQIEVRDNAA